MEHSSNLSLLATSGASNDILPIFTLQNYIQDKEYIFFGKILLAINVIVILINILVIVTLIKGNFRKSTHVIMAAIAITDSLTGLVSLPFNIYVLTLDANTDYFTLQWCYIHDFMQQRLPGMFHMASLHLTVGLAVERYIVVAFPLKVNNILTIRRGIVLCITIFVISVCSQIDLFTQVKIKEVMVKSETSNTTFPGCAMEIKVRSNTEFVFRAIFLVFLPCLSLFIFTFLLLRTSKEIKQRRRQLFSNTNQESSSSKLLERLDLAVILMLVFILITEVLVWTSYILSRVYNIRFTDDHHDVVGIGLTIFQVTSPINLIILCFLSAKFKQTIVKILCGCCKRTCNYGNRYIPRLHEDGVACKNTRF